MIRTLIFGAIAGYVGKKLYDEGKLTEFKDDLVSRYNEARGNLSSRSSDSSLSGSATTTGGIGTSSASSTPAMAHGNTGPSAAPSLG